MHLYSKLFKVYHRGTKWCFGLVLLKNMRYKRISNKNFNEILRFFAQNSGLKTTVEESNQIFYMKQAVRWRALHEETFCWVSFSINLPLKCYGQLKNWSLIENIMKKTLRRSAHSAKFWKTDQLTFLKTLRFVILNV